VNDTSLAILRRLASEGPIDGKRLRRTWREGDWGMAEDRALSDLRMDARVKRLENGAWAITDVGRAALEAEEQADVFAKETP